MLALLYGPGQTVVGNLWATWTFDDCKRANIYPCTMFWATGFYYEGKLEYQLVRVWGNNEHNSLVSGQQEASKILCIRPAISRIHSLTCLASCNHVMMNEYLIVLRMFWRRRWVAPLWSTTPNIIKQDDSVLCMTRPEGGRESCVGTSMHDPRGKEGRRGGD